MASQGLQSQYQKHAKQVSLPLRAEFGKETENLVDDDGDVVAEQEGDRDVLFMPNSLPGIMLGEFLEKLINRHGEQHVLKVLEENEHLF